MIHSMQVIPKPSASDESGLSVSDSLLSSRTTSADQDHFLLNLAVLDGQVRPSLLDIGSESSTDQFSISLSFVSCSYATCE